MSDEARKKRFERIAGVVQFALLLPMGMGVLAAIGLLQFVVMVVVGYGETAWLHGTSIDFGTVTYDPDVLEAFADPENPDANAIVALMSALLPPRWLFLSVLLQNVGFFALSVLLITGTGAIRRRRLGVSDTWAQTLTAGLGLRRASPGLLAVGLFGGLALMWLPSAFMQLLQRVVELDNTSGELLFNAVQQSTSAEMALAVFTIALAVPLMEELLFRGFLWNLGEYWLPPWVVLILTSLMFAVFHMSPAHVLGVLLHAFFLGWLRMHSGSIWPSVLAHVANNGLAVVLFSLSDGDEAMSAVAIAVMAIGGFLGISTAFWAAWRLRLSDDNAGPQSAV